MTITATLTPTATAKQIGFMGKLAAERGIAFDANAWTEGTASRQARTEIDRLLAMPKPAAAPRTSRAPRTTTEVPEGHYATPRADGSNDLDFWRIDKPETGKWAGWVFVKKILGGHDPIKVRGAEAAGAISAIEAATWQEAAAVYGREIGQCSHCHRELTDVVSRYTGHGPTCRKNKGITVSAETRVAAIAWATDRGLLDLLGEGDGEG